MSIDAKEVDVDKFDRWNQLVDQSTDATVFHRTESLKVQETHSMTELHPLVGFKGEEPVGIFPLFARRQGPVTAVFSPPPALWVPRLGPAVVQRNRLNKRNAERRLYSLIDGCFEWFDRCGDVRFGSVTTTTKFSDVRPFK